MSMTNHGIVSNTLALQERLPEATRRFEMAIAVSPTDDKAYNSLGVSLDEQGDADGAAAAFGDALRLNPASKLAADNLQRVRDAAVGSGGSAGARGRATSATGGGSGRLRAARMRIVVEDVGGVQDSAAS